MEFQRTFIASILLIAALALFAAGCGPSGPSRYDDFAKCLTEKGAVMYGTEWCPHCKTQKELFGDSFKYVNYVDCDKNSGECIAKGIEGYPTWIIGGGKYPGVQQFTTLKQLSGCEIEPAATEPASAQ
ncbi:MAG TPA: hypothetical protein VJI75_06950 [Candidatus Nanoarchaeia archaeon]|nr:hypothetical protein [Candidatus Nanoarchaeia archaeon]